MPITLRKVNMKVKDPVSGNFLPVDMFDGNVLEGIETAKEEAINEIAETESQALQNILPSKTTVTGSSLEIYARSATNAIKLELTLPVAQTGSGDPTPSNIRPITLYHQIVINILDDEDNIIRTYTVNLSDDFCQGVFDLVNGKVVVTKKYIKFDGTESWYAQGGYYYKNLDSNLVINDVAFSSHCLDNPRIASGNSQVGFRVYNAGVSTNVPRIVFRPDVDTIIDRPSLYAWLTNQFNNGTPFQIAYTLQEPIVYDFDSTEISINRGYNKIISTPTGALKIAYMDEDHLTPQTYGAVGDGITDDTIAIQKAINDAYVRNVPLIMNNTYAISDTILVKGKISGTGEILLYDQTQRLNNGFFKTVADTIIDGLSFNCYSSVEYTRADKNNENDDLKSFNEAIKHNTGSLIVKNCYFYHLYNAFIRLTGNTLTKISISNNIFNTNEQVNKYKATCIGCNNINNANETIIDIVNNRFFGYESGTWGEKTTYSAAGIVVTNTLVSQFNICDNILSHMGRLATDPDVTNGTGYSRLCAIDFYYNSKNIIISNNKLLQSNWTPIRIHGCQNVQIVNNEFESQDGYYINQPIIWISDSINSTGEAPVGVKNINISSNLIYSPLNPQHAQRIIILTSPTRHNPIASQDKIPSQIDSIIIKDNIITNVNCEAAIYLDDSVKKCIIKNNCIDIPNNNTYGIQFSDTPNVRSHTNLNLEILDNKFNCIASCIDLSNCVSPGSIVIKGNTLNTSNSQLYCINGKDNTYNIIVMFNNLNGAGGGLLNVQKAIMNISNCSETHYDNCATTFNNYPAPAPAS